MTTVDLERTFRRSFGGAVITPSDDGYDTAREVWNGAIDPYPKILARCLTPDDIVEAVNLARTTGSELIVRAGGHSVAGFSGGDGGIVVDLSPMGSIVVDPRERTAIVEPGATWATFDAATTAHGLATTGGLVSTTGVAGLTLGGGLGWLQRKYGLACDNLIAADVVTASGDIVHTSEMERPDLLWGLRGGGGNFGIVSRFVFSLNPISTVLGGMLVFPISRGPEILRAFREWSANLPDEATMIGIVMSVPTEPFAPSDLVGQKAVTIAGCWCGDIEAGNEVLAPMRALRPVADLFSPIPYTTMQTMLDAVAPAGMRHYFRSGYLNDLSDQAIDIFIDGGDRMPSPMSSVLIYEMGGAVGRVPEGATPFNGRGAAYTYNLQSTWFEEPEDEQHIRVSRELAAELEPLSLDRTFVNFLESGTPERVRSAFGESIYGRLAHLKKEYDPTNLFHHNQNVLPAD